MKCSRMLADLPDGHADRTIGQRIREYTRPLGNYVTADMNTADAQVPSTARDQHRPANSRPIAVLMCVGDHGAFGAGVEMLAAGIQASVGLLAPIPRGRTGAIPAPPQINPGPIRLAVMPGCLDQQAAGVTVAGLGDRLL